MQYMYHVYLLQKKNQNKSEDKFIPYIYFGDHIWCMGYTLLHWYKLVKKYNEINNVVEWLMHTFHMNSFNIT